MKGLAVALGAGLLVVVAGPSRAATPAHGTVDATQTEVRWSGSTTAQSAGLQGGGCQLAVPDPTCDFFELSVGALGPLAPADDVQVAISAPNGGLTDFDLYVYGPDGAEVGRSVNIGSGETVLLTNPAPATYTVAVQTALASEPSPPYDAVARAVDGSNQAPVDAETPCGFEGAPELRQLDAATGQGIGALAGDPTAAFDGLDHGQPVSLDVLVILDGISQHDAETLFATAARSYAPLNVQLHAARFMTHTFDTNEAAAIIRGAKALVGGRRPSDVDIVEVLTNKDIQQLGQNAVAGLADCIGGVAHPDRAFLVAEATTPSDIAIGPAVFDYEANPNVSAHEIGHLLGGQHHYANCVEGVQASDVHQDKGTVEVSPCTLMFNAADFLGPNFDTLNGAIVRGSALRYAQP